MCLASLPLRSTIAKPEAAYFSGDGHQAKRPLCKVVGYPEAKHPI